MATKKFEYDIIFAGGGSTACLIAGRLATADPNIRILITESGPHTRDDPAHVQPGRFLDNLRPDSKTVKTVVGKPTNHLNDNQAVVPTAACVGGRSSVNNPVYARPSASDYDDWKDKYQNQGWGAKDLVPLLKKAETYQIQDDLATHGYSGPLQVSYGGFYSNIAQDFLQVAKSYDTARGHTDDPNAIYSGVNQFARWPAWIDEKTGRRSDIPHNYIYNQSHKNLTIESGVIVKRVVIEDNRATGIEYVENPAFRPNANGEVTFVKAKHLVVVAGGALGSPLILERSGIGSKAVLSKLGIDIVVDLPGVGEHYEDHPIIHVPYLTHEDSQTYDFILQKDQTELQKWNAQWLKNGTGMLANNGLNAGIKMRPSEEELKAIGPIFQKRWQKHYATNPDKPLSFIGPIALYDQRNGKTDPPQKTFEFSYSLYYPSSKGYIHVISKADVFSEPDFDPGYLSAPEDVPPLVWAYKRSREFARRMSCFRGEYVPGHPNFPSNSQAKAAIASGPVPISSPDLTYSSDDDKAIETWIRSSVTTMSHSLGTCSMKPREDGGVVDRHLNVYGVLGLKVADVSIAPSNVSADTYSSAIAIGEKAALIIANELGIEGVV
ncbi:GMC oxidoreductase family protein [Abortiporus biennis]